MKFCICSLINAELISKKFNDFIDTATLMHFDKFFVKVKAACNGDEEDRTLDLTDANRTLSQLSYAP